jgi:hypothetical protein
VGKTGERLAASSSLTKEYPGLKKGVNAGLLMKKKWKKEKKKKKEHKK